MLVLALADFNATREMGPILALGVAVMVAAGLTLLPAILGDARPARVLAGRPAGGGRGARPCGGLWREGRAPGRRRTRRSRRRA